MKKNMEKMKPVVVIKVKFFQTNSNRKTGSNERVWETNKRINEAERKDCLRLLSWFDFWKTCSYLILFLFYCLLSLFVSSFRLETRKLAFCFTILFYHATSLLKCILNFYVLVLINESKSTLLQIAFKHILVLQSGNKSFCSLFFIWKLALYILLSFKYFLWCNLEFFQKSLNFSSKSPHIGKSSQKSLIYSPFPHFF